MWGSVESTEWSMWGNHRTYVKKPAIWFVNPNCDIDYIYAWMSTGKCDEILKVDVTGIPQYPDLNSAADMWGEWGYTNLMDSLYKMNTSITPDHPLTKRMIAFTRSFCVVDPIAPDRITF